MLAAANAAAAAVATSAASMASVVASNAPPPPSSWTSVGSSTPKTVSFQKTTSVSAALAAKPQKHQSKRAAAHQMTNSSSTPKQPKISGLFQKVEGRAKLRLREVAGHNWSSLTAKGLPPFTHQASMETISLPAWLRHLHTKFELTALVVDYWHVNGNPSSRLHQYLQLLGFNSTFDDSQSQIGLSCGVVAAKVAVSLHMAGTHFQEDTTHHVAASSEVLRDANTILVSMWNAFSDQSKADLAEDQLKVMFDFQDTPHRNHTCFISVADILCLASKWWWRARGLADEAVIEEDPGPPCFRCGQYGHWTKNCRVYSLPRSQRSGAETWLTVDTLDAVVVKIVASLSEAFDSGSSSADGPPNVLIANNSVTGADGIHWFTVAYSIRPKSSVSP